MREGGGRFVAVAALSAALLIAPTAAGAAGGGGDWAQNGFDVANTHFNPRERTLGRDNAAQLTPTWNLDVDVTSSPAVVGDRVFVTAQTAVNAYRASTGALLWSRPNVMSYDGSVAVDGDVVVAASLPHDGLTTPLLYALATANGAVLWKLKIPGYNARDLVVANGRVYVSTRQAIEVIDLATHTVIRKLRVSDELTSPQVIDGHVFAAGIYNHELYSFAEATGKREWHVSIGDQLLLVDDAVSDAVVVVPSEDGAVYAVDESDGSPLWNFQTDTKFPGAVAIAKGVVYFGDYNGDFYTLDLHAGNPRWNVNLGKQATDEPTVANGVVYLTTQDKNLRALDVRSGAPLFTGAVGAISSGNVVVSNGSVFVSGATGHLRRWGLPG